MKNNMSLEWVADKACWRFFNGDAPAREIFLSPAEISFIEHALEQNAWKAELEMEIDSNDDSLDFGEISKADFLDLCMDEMESKWECQTLFDNPDYQEIVFDVANENGIWRG